MCPPPETKANKCKSCPEWILQPHLSHLASPGTRSKPADCVLTPLTGFCSLTPVASHLQIELALSWQTCYVSDE